MSPSVEEVQRRFESMHRYLHKNFGHTADISQTASVLVLGSIIRDCSFGDMSEVAQSVDRLADSLNG